MIDRDLTSRLGAAARRFPAVMLTGPRQSGKSTLCRMVFPKHTYVNLEAPDVRTFAASDPRRFLAQFERGAILDEFQRLPELTSYLQALIDEDPKRGRWILTGSQSLTMMESVSQSLAGRTAVLHLLPLTREESCRFKRHPKSLDEAMFTGGYPRILDQRLAPGEWLGSYVRTYVDRDVRQIAAVTDLSTFQRFVQLCASRTSQLLNLSPLALDAGISQPTAKAWLSILEATFIAFRLHPWVGNVGKRLVKTPKLHFYDTGLVCWLLGIREPSQLRLHPLRGPIFETWAVTEILKHRFNRGEHAGVYFYRDRHGLEADVIIEEGRTLLVVGAKAGQTATTELVSAGRRVVDALAGAADVKRVVVFAGDAGQKRSDVELVSWRSMGGRRW
ncbi:MAG: ATP-binding protein [Phycisphaerales bacterium]|nr:MAG: ATP-binding protein [Phycisphaerales bacterium]